MKRLAPLALIALAPITLTLPGCGLHPLYAGGESGPVATGLAQVEVAPIGGKTGWLMTNALRDRLPSRGDSPALYRLDIKLSDSIEGLGVRADDTVTRERRTLRARYQLVNLANGDVLLDASAGSDEGIDVVSSEYATIAAESTAMENLTQVVADQIVTRIAVYARNAAKK